jgi:hypothetical protein
MFSVTSHIQENINLELKTETHRLSLREVQEANTWNSFTVKTSEMFMFPAPYENLRDDLRLMLMALLECRTLESNDIFPARGSVVVMLQTGRSRVRDVMR